jgi:hypothetical protein
MYASGTVFLASTIDLADWCTLRHHSGLAASPRVRYNLDMGGENTFLFRPNISGEFFLRSRNQTMPLPEAEAY